MICADYAATTALSKVALSAMMPYFTEQYGNPGSTHTAGAKAARAILLAQESIARDLHGLPQEVYFIPCGSEANSQALYTLAELGRQTPVFTDSRWWSGMRRTRRHRKCSRYRWHGGGAARVLQQPCS